MAKKNDDQLIKYRDRSGMPIKPEKPHRHYTEDGKAIVCFVENGFKQPADLQNMLKLRDQLDRAPGYLLDALGEPYLICEHIIDYANIQDATKAILRQVYYRRRRDFHVDEIHGLEKMLIENILTTWLALEVTRHEYTIIIHGGYALDVFKYWEGRLNNAQLRYDRAIAAWANVVSKLGPHFDIQINVAQDGGQQVNIGK